MCFSLQCHHCKLSHETDVAVTSSHGKGDRDRCIGNLRHLHYHCTMIRSAMQLRHAKHTWPRTCIGSACMAPSRCTRYQSAKAQFAVGFPLLIHCISFVVRSRAWCRVSQLTGKPGSTCAERGAGATAERCRSTPIPSNIPAYTMLIAQNNIRNTPCCSLSRGSTDRCAGQFYCVLSQL